MLAVASFLAAAITGGAASDDPAVVALVRGEEIVCSGTVIAPRAILTAAHCATGGATEVVLDGAVAAGGARVRVVAWIVDPDFVAATLAHDVAIAIVDPGVTIAPVPIAAAPDGIAVGDLVRVVGYGRIAAGDTTAPARRAGTSHVDALTTDAIATSAAPSQTCEGDSGGPALRDIGGSGEEIVGVASSGDTACAAGASHVRASGYAAFASAAITATADGVASAGARCWYDANCAAGAGPCQPAVDEPRWSFCAPACGADGACPDGLACSAGNCVHPAPSPGAIGAACAGAADCAGGLCVAPAGGGDAVCSDRCFPDLPGLCPGGLACAPATDGADACFATAPAGGCAASGRGDPAVALAIVALIVRPRRRRAVTSR